MPMQDVKAANSIDELKRMAFVNFHMIQKHMDVVEDNVIDTSTTEIKTTTATGGNLFDIVYLKDNSTWITRNASGDLVLHDKKAGDITLSQIKVLLAILWTYGDALGVKMKNLAGTELMVGITEDADGLTFFTSDSEVE